MYMNLGESWIPLRYTPVSLPKQCVFYGRFCTSILSGEKWPTTSNLANTIETIRTLPYTLIYSVSCKQHKLLPSSRESIMIGHFHREYYPAGASGKEISVSTKIPRDRKQSLYLVFVTRALQTYIKICIASYMRCDKVGIWFEAVVSKRNVRLT